jgi:hypothetical protein
MGKYRCEECGTEMPLPKHCGREMLQDPTRKDHVVCWMNLDPKFGGKKCGEQKIPEHHGKLMKIVK